MGVSTSVLRYEWERVVVKRTSFEKIHHYIPPIFPIEPTLDGTVMRNAAASWNHIRSQTVEMKSGVVDFFDNFYRKLFARNESLASIFPTDIQFKGRLLVTVMSFLTRINVENEKEKKNTVKIIEYLALKHRHMLIRPWMYSIYLEILIETISECLGDYASNEVIQSWTQIASFFLINFLPLASTGLINEEEFAMKIKGIETTDKLLLASKKEMERRSRNQNLDISVSAHFGLNKEKEENAGLKLVDPRAMLEPVNEVNSEMKSETSNRSEDKSEEKKNKKTVAEKLSSKKVHPIQEKT